MDVAKHLDHVALLAKALNQAGIAFQGPHLNGLGGTRMNDNLAAFALVGEHAVGRKIKPECFRQSLPVQITMGERFPGIKGMSKEHLTAQPWKPVASLSH